MSIFAALGQFGSQYKEASDEFDTIGKNKLAAERQRLADETARMDRWREEGRRQVAMQTPTLQPGGEIKVVGDEAAATGKPGLQTGGGAGYVPRKTGKVTDRTVEVSEAANRLAAAKRMAEAKPQIQFSRMVEQDGKLTHIPAADNRGKSSGVISPEQINTLQSRLTDLQSQEGARQRGREPVSTPANAPLSVRNNNPGNLKFAGQPGATADARGFAVFQTPEAGAAAADRQLGLYMQRDGLNTVRGIVNKWSPVSDPGNAPGSTANYANYVAKQLGVNPDAPLSVQDIPRLRQAMSQFEAGTTATSQPQVAAPQAPQATVQATQNFGPGPASGPNLLIQQEMARVKNMMQYGKDASAVEQYNQLYRSMQFADLEQRAGQDPQALGNLAHNVGTQVYQNQQGFFRVARNASGQMVPMEPPMSSTMMAARLREMADPVYKAAVDQSRAKLNFEMQKAQMEYQIAMQKGEVDLAKQAMANANALQLKLMELGQPKVAVDSAQGGAFVTQNGQVSYMRPGVDAKFGQSGATTQAVQ